jgi:multidrug efflux pump subunit AcrA (membrane-fusion protein)
MHVVMFAICRLLIVSSCCIALVSCSKAPPVASQLQADTDRRIQEEAAKIAAERERLAELQQEQREKVAADLASRTDTREARRAANLEHAAAEQARREGITAELKTFIDSIWTERSQINDVQTLRMNGQPVKPGSVLVSPAGYSVKYLKEDGDYFWFGYDEDAFSIALKKAASGLSVADVKYKQPLAEGFQVDQKLPEAPSGGSVGSTLAGSRGLLVLKATYGADSVQRDVKDIVKSKIQNGRLDFRAHSGELGGDPIFGKVKTFYIKYVANGRVLERSFREGEHVSLP